MRALLALAILMSTIGSAHCETVRLALFNANLVRQGAGVLISDMDKGNRQVSAVVEIILRVRPDILLINEIDHDPEGLALGRLVDLLRAGAGGQPGLSYPHRFLAPSNTGVPSGFDLDGDGGTMTADDAIGFGRFPGQYAMALISRFPIAGARTFRTFRWSRLPWAVEPRDPDGVRYYPEAAWKVLPFSSKSHWDVEIDSPAGTLHVLASHPTPPVFDGPENRNGLRNAAEIRFWADYVDGADWVVDDGGTRGGLPPGASFVVMGDLNNDPVDGDGDKAAIRTLLTHPRVQDPRPRSEGARLADGRKSLLHAADPALDTADWREDANGPGNLRVDYVLPSTDLRVTGAGVFWPAQGEEGAALVSMKGRRPASSDHRLVWVDIAVD